ncbi:hypothetical protein MBT42_39220 [Streptomyces sp. MBT42]|uniref:hypothetical protein n=1 Tax=Streptomyces sp. MBT42 TaxID=1488373 RepID=UPI001E2AA472|nr:hypothetical protein [Streptomyces sp. MBT42]MCD2469547.1 hypothetical protein [Streptomyces sp. MBT42]
MYPARSSSTTALSAASRKSAPSGQWRVPGVATVHGKRSAAARTSVASSGGTGAGVGAGSSAVVSSGAGEAGCER